MSIKSHLTSSNSNKRFIKATTSGSGGLSVSQQAAVDLYANIVQYQYLMVGGGGTTGTSDGTTGGGGAGMFTQGNIILQKNVSTNVIIGAGGAGWGGSPTISLIPDRGGESWLRQGDTILIAIGGGRSGIPSASEGTKRGGSFAWTGHPGGSGGGATAGGGANYAGGEGIVGGYPGGESWGSQPYGGGGGGGGATQAGYPWIGSSPPSNKGRGGNGANISWVPTNYGTPGWGPGRWFAGGGGGSYNDGSPFGTLTLADKRQGGAGGGGVGGALGPGTLQNGSSGNVNTGGGAGGHFGPAPGTYTVNGGSGVVIFNVPLSATWINAIGANVETTATGNIIGFRTSGQITFT